MAQLYSHTRGEPVFASEFIGELVDHLEQHIFHISLVEGILHKGSLFRHRLLLAIRDDETSIYTIGLFPEFTARLTKLSLEQLDRQFAEDLYFSYPHKGELLIGLLADARNLLDRERREEAFFCTSRDLTCPIGFILTGADLRDQFID